MKNYLTILFSILALNCFSNNPYPDEEAKQNIYYTFFTEEPKYLDPARSYSSDEYQFIEQIYEPLLQYHMLKRPSELIPQIATEIPKAKRVGNHMVYTIQIRNDVKFQDHAAFAKDANNRYYYHLKKGQRLPSIEHPDELAHKSSRILTVDDYIYQITRMAHPKLHCPIVHILHRIDGFAEVAKEIHEKLEVVRAARKKAGGVFFNQAADERENPIYLDLRKFKIRGVKKIDDFTFTIALKNPYPQFVYWLAMPFFAPVPWEAERLYMQPQFAELNMSINRFPIGTGAYKLSYYQPNYRIELTRNKNFHYEYYPTEGDEDDQQAGRLDDAGKKLPFIDKAVFVLEKESIPRWNKFTQGYFEASTIQAEAFDQVVSFSTEGVALSSDLISKGVSLVTTELPSIRYFAFNMIDDQVGGYSARKKKLRQAISMVIDIQEFVTLFLSGRGSLAHGPIPAGIFGHHKNDINPIVYSYDEILKKPVLRNLNEAKKKLADAGYTNGIGPDKKQLVLFYDTVQGGPRSTSINLWLVKQLKKLNIDLQIRETDYSQFREKVLNGNYQILSWGWNADYPDPENFLSLLYGPNSKVKSKGENTANYDSPVFNRLFRQIENMQNNDQRMAFIKRAVKILREDSPWVFGNFSTAYGLYHSWYKNAKPTPFGGNTLKYKRVNVEERQKKRGDWNQAESWFIYLLLFLFLVITVPAILKYIKEDRGLDKASQVFKRSCSNI